MNPALIAVCFQIASKVGPALYSQMADLLGAQVPAGPILPKSTPSWMR